MLDTGNVLFGGSRVSRRVRGAVHIDAMNAMGYAAMNVAERDLRWGMDTLVERQSEARFPFLSATLVISGTDAPLHQPYALFDVDGVPVAVMGLAISQIPAEHRRPLVSGEMIDTLDPIATARRLLPEIRERADVVVVLSHMGIEQDIELARQVQGIDAILGGVSRRVEDVPFMAEGADTVITCAGYQGQWLGVLTLSFDVQGNVTAFDGETLSLTDEFPDDPDMVERVDGWIDRANEIEAKTKGVGG